MCKAGVVNIYLIDGVTAWPPTTVNTFCGYKTNLVEYDKLQILRATDATVLQWNRDTWNEPQTVSHSSSNSPTINQASKLEDIEPQFWKKLVKS